MIHNIFHSSLVTAGSEQGRVSQGSINGLICTLDQSDGINDFTDDLELTVTLKGVETDVLVNGVGMRQLAGMADFFGGTSAAGVTLNLDNPDAGDTTDLATSTVRAFALDLGIIHLGATNSEIEVKVHNRTGGVAIVSVASYFDHDGPEEIYQIYASADKKDRYPNCESLFLVGSDLPGVANDQYDVNVLINGPHGSTVCRFVDIVGYAGSRGDYPVYGPSMVFNCYQASDILHDNVDIQVTGPDVGSLTLLGRQTLRNYKRISQGTIASTSALASRVENLDPFKAKAMRRAGYIPKANVLRGLASSGNTGGSSANPSN